MQMGHQDMFPVGSRVRVATSVVVYHYPGHRNDPYELQGQEGQVIDVVREWQGKPVSANLPVVVKLGEKFKAHFQESELELLSE